MDYITRLVLDPERLTATIKANLENGQTLANFEKKLTNTCQQIEILEQAEAKVLRLHLYLSDYPVEKLRAEQLRIEQQRQQLTKEKSNLEAQIDELKQAIVDQEEIKHFCEIVANNLEKMTDKQWGYLIETLRLKIMIAGKAIVIEGAVPVSNVEAVLQSGRR